MMAKTKEPRIRLYFPNLLLTFLLVFCLIGTELMLLVQHTALNAEAFRKVEEAQQLSTKASQTLESYFKTRANSTGIPAELFLQYTDENTLSQGIHASVEAAFAYLNGEREQFDYSRESMRETLAFDRLETSVTDFFSSYADENGYAKDATYEAKVAQTIAEAEEEILFVTDVFKLRTLSENKWLPKIRKIASNVGTGTALCIAVTALVIVLLILCNLKQRAHIAYWLGLAAAIAGLLLGAPMVWCVATDFFSGFAVKDPQIFAAVVGYLQMLTKDALVMAVVTLAAGLVLFGVFAFCMALRREEEADISDLPGGAA